MIGLPQMANAPRTYLLCMSEGAHNVGMPDFGGVPGLQFSARMFFWTLDLLVYDLRKQMKMWLTLNF